MENQAIFFLLNGAGTLILETAWLKKQMAIFGAVPESYGSILFAYFLGVSAGSWFFRNRQGTTISRRVLYGGFVAALLLSLMLPLLLFKGLPISVSFVFRQLVLYKVLVWTLAILAIFPACFFLGAFFPLVALTVDRRNFVLLYGIQTMGALLGIYFGAFHLPYTCGYLATFIIGIAVNALSLLFLERALRQPLFGEALKAQQVAEGSISLRFSAVSFVSGFLSLLLQVLWIRFIALGTDNSIYAFGSASLLILLQLTIASAVTSRLPLSWFKDSKLLHVTLLLSLLGVMVSAQIYVHLTNGLAIRQVTNAAGLFSSILFAASFMIPGYFFPSFIFPIIMRMAKSGEANLPGDLQSSENSFLLGSTTDGRGQGYTSVHEHDTAGNIGAVIAANGIGCALGSFIASFFFLPKLGMWSSLLIALLGYVLFTLLLERISVRLVAAVPAILLIFVFNPQKYPLVTPVNPFAGTTDYGSVISVREGKYGIVSVIDYENRIRTLWLNNTYLLEYGENKPAGAYRMGLLPTVLNPAARSLGMIGIGTGILSNGFLNSRIGDITLIEMIPEVAEAALIHFSLFNGNVLQNPRVKTIIDDGRHYLQISQKKLDIICSDFFTPWNEGTAYLYTVDHFKNVKEKLNPGGLFCLWLPVFQLTKEEFLIIAKSFASVFPHSTIWQNDRFVNEGAIALVGSERIQTEQIQSYMTNLPFSQIQPDLIQSGLSGIFSRYVGPVVLSDEWKNIPLNTLDRPVIEFLAAQSNRRLLKGEAFLLLLQKFVMLPGNPDQSYFTYYDSGMNSARMSGWYLNLFDFYSKLGNHTVAEYYRLKGVATLPASFSNLGL